MVQATKPRAVLGGATPDALADVVRDLLAWRVAGGERHACAADSYVVRHVGSSDC